MNKLLSITLIFLFCISVTRLPALSSEKPIQPKGIEAGTIPGADQIKITNPAQKDKVKSTGNEKSNPSIVIKSASITRTDNGLWRWQIIFDATENRQVAANTAKIRVWLDAGGKRNILATKVYDRVINPPTYAMLQDAFFPSGPSDSLYFELIEMTPGVEGGIGLNQDNVVDQTTVDMPPFNIELLKANYDYMHEPGRFFIELKNNSSWPLLLRVTMHADNHTAQIHYYEEPVLVAARSTSQVIHEWTFKEKGGGRFLVTVETQLMDTSSGKIVWTKILEKVGNLPTYR